MAGWTTSSLKLPVIVRAVAVVTACAGVMACKGGGGSPNSPSGGGGGLPAGSSCRTVATSTHSVQQFMDGTNVTVTSDTTCSYFTANNDVVCQSPFVDSVGGPGNVSQTTRFLSRADIVDEAAVNPPRSLSPGTTTVTNLGVGGGGLSLTTTATNTYDSQRRLTKTEVVTPLAVAGQLTQTFTFTAWDASARPTAGTLVVSPGPTNPISYTYDNAARTVTRNTGLNTCTVTHDSNGIMIKEVCTGTSPSTTTITINSTTQICK